MIVNATVLVTTLFPSFQTIVSRQRMVATAAFLLFTKVEHTMIASKIKVVNYGAQPRQITTLMDSGHIAKVMNLNMLFIKSNSST